MKKVIILSGGMDSTTLFKKEISEGHEVFPIHFNYGQNHSRERELAEKICSDHGVTLTIINMSEIFKNLNIKSALLKNQSEQIPNIWEIAGDPQPPTYVPFRNLLFLIVAAAYAESRGANIISYGATKVDTQSYWDGSLEFFNLVNDILNLNRKHKITLEAPLINLEKHEIIKLGVRIGVDYSQTHTCYRGTKIACGTCMSCSTRIAAFCEAGYIDPVPYAIDIPWPENCIDLRK